MAIAKEATGGQGEQMEEREQVEEGEQVVEGEQGVEEEEKHSGLG